MSLGTLRIFKKLLALQVSIDASADITFFRRKFSVSFYRKLSLGTLQFFKKTLARKACMDKRRGYHVFPSNFFSNHSTRKFYWEPFVVSEAFWYRKKYMDMTGGISKVRQTFFDSNHQKVSLGTLRLFKNFLVAKKLHG